MESSAARVASINVSPGGVPKLPVDDAWVGNRGLAGDGHNEPEPSHGGPEQAVCLYSVESIARVAGDGHTAFPGAFGENLTLEGIELLSLASGDRLAIGDGGVVIQLTKRSEPCQTIAHWFADRRIARIGSPQHPEDTRWYARVLHEGLVRTGDRVERLGPEASV
jgi:MOSC domain-containing protein YiiM